MQILKKKSASFPQDGMTMNQRDGFTGGFIAGTIVGSLLGGAIGALLASGRSSELAADAVRRNPNLSEGNNSKRQRRQFKAANSEQSIELARRSLEDKIAQLNETIDEVRLTLGEVNGIEIDESPVERGEDNALRRSHRTKIIVNPRSIPKEWMKFQVPFSRF